MSEDERKKALSKHRKKLEEKRLKLQSKIKKKEKQKNDDNIGRINPSFQSDDPKGDFYISPKENKEMMEEFSNLINKNKGLNNNGGCMGVFVTFFIILLLFITPLL